MGLFKKDPWQIITFKTYGTNTHLYLKGRAIEDEGIDLSKSGFFHLFFNSFKRFETDKIKYQKISVTIANGATFETLTDTKGYYLIDEQLDDLSESIDNKGWLVYTIKFTEVSPKQGISQGNMFYGNMLIPSAASEFAVISDIDDTILHTGVVSRFKWRLLVNTLFKKVERRVPLEGTTGFYDQLHLGSDGKQANPIYYVSHSPWNLYRYLDSFLDYNDFPEGPILLRTLSTVFKRKNGSMPQKQKEIIQLLKTYPLQKFILIGDSGENDADIYIEITEVFPNRIKAIYLRSVKHEKRMLRIQKRIENHKTTPVLLVDTTDQAIAHARKHGFIV